MGRYANQTTVSVAKSKAEIEDILQRYGCEGFMSGWLGDQAMLSFQTRERQVRFLMILPDMRDEAFTKTATGKDRTTDAAYKAWEQACRQRWRALALVIKAKLEAVECGIVTFDQEFLAHIVTTDGVTVGQQVIPALMAGETPRISL